MTLSLPSRPIHGAGLLWGESQPGIWVGRFDGDILGAIAHRRSFIATDARGDVVGTFETLGEAQQSLAPEARAARQRRRRASTDRAAVIALVCVLPAAGLFLVAALAFGQAL